MRSAEGGKKVVKRVLVGDVDGRELETDLVLVAVKQVILPHRNVEQIPRRDALRMVIVIFGVRWRHGNERRRELHSQAWAGQRLRWSRTYAIASKSRLKFLIRSQGRTADGVNQIDRGLSTQLGRCTCAGCVGVARTPLQVNPA